MQKELWAVSRLRGESALGIDALENSQKMVFFTIHSLTLIKKGMRDEGW